MEFVVVPKKWDTTPTVRAFYRDFRLKNAYLGVKMDVFSKTTKSTRIRNFCLI
jgi:hypothetical protein